MNNPFDYEPSKEMLCARQQALAHIETMSRQSPAFRKEVDKGKMFGILITHDAKGIKRMLLGFSGQIADSYDWDGFVPPVFDYLDEKGYFKVHESQISLINKEIKELEKADGYLSLKNVYVNMQEEAKEDIKAYQSLIKQSKAERDKQRLTGDCDDEALIRESQFMKAELHRKKMTWQSQLELKKHEIEEYEAHIRTLKMQRQHDSNELQQWLFRQFAFVNYKGEKKTLLDIFHTYADVHHVSASCIPSGAGECCEPKLLNYAFTHDLNPIEIGMFWYGESPKQEIRRSLEFYPACNGKCRPILSFMLGLDNDQDEDPIEPSVLKTIYEDDSIIVVNKPSGMLSVPGKSKRQSVYSILRDCHPECTELQMVHRLDMDTSGLLVVAKTDNAHKCLQKQFLDHKVKKTYVALLEHPFSGEGRIELNLRPDYVDRPRQMVDMTNGKPAVTSYRSLGGNRIELHPHTGRTHQLRVHCAHQLGLANPIVGDRLYGKRSGRLFLHAENISFVHPVTLKTVCFESAPDF